MGAEPVSSMWPDKERSREIRRQIRRVLLEKWDPIGISEDSPDEYDMYFGSVYELLKRDAEVGEIIEYLRWVESSRMELNSPEHKRNAAAIALKEIASTQFQKPTS